MCTEWRAYAAESHVFSAINNPLNLSAPLLTTGGWPLINTYMSKELSVQ